MFWNPLIEAFLQALKRIIIKTKKKRSVYALRFQEIKKMLTDISEVSFSDGHDDGAFYACGSQSSCAFFSFRKAY